jgi:hypothetical protein
MFIVVHHITSTNKTSHGLCHKFILGRNGHQKITISHFFRSRNWFRLYDYSNVRKSSSPAAYQLAIFALCVSITMPSIEVLLASSLADAILTNTYGGSVKTKYTRNSLMGKRIASSQSIRFRVHCRKKVVLEIRRKSSGKYN